MEVTNVSSPTPKMIVAIFRIIGSRTFKKNKSFSTMKNGTCELQFAADETS